jgi:dienelactone hydrolase
LAIDDDCLAQQADDVVHILDWLGQQPGVDSSRLGLVGFGHGGHVALLAASRTALLRSVVAFFPVGDVAQLDQTTPYQSVGDHYIASICRAQAAARVWPLASVSSITASVLLIHGERDDSAPLSQSEAMKEALQSAGKPVELYVLPHAGHDLIPHQFDKAWPWVVKFLARHQMLSVAWRTSEQQRRVNLFTERGWSSRLGVRGMKTLRALGRITKQVVVITPNPHVPGRTDEMREFVFDGLYVQALFPGRAHDGYLLQQVEITKSRWKTKFGLNVGTIRSLIVDTLGKADSEKPGFLEYSHSMGIGTVRISMTKDRIAKLAWQFRAD